MCTLGLDHNAGLHDVEATLTSFRSKFDRKQVTEFQLGIIEQAAMQAVWELRFDKAASVDDVRKYFHDSFGVAFDIWRPAWELRAATSKAGSACQHVPE